MTVQPPETIVVAENANEVCCDGGGGALGHPIVWYSFDRAMSVECGYCDRRFVKRHDAQDMRTG